MSTKYKFRDPDGIYFVTFAVVGWVDVFTRRIYREILIDSFKYCQASKGLVIHARIIMSNHVHMIISRNGKFKLEEIMRDMKKFTSYKILGAIMDNKTESRREWMLDMFEAQGTKNSNNTKFQFWRQDNHPVLLDTNQMMDERLDYLHNNPVKDKLLMML